MLSLSLLFLLIAFSVRTVNSMNIMGSWIFGGSAVMCTPAF